MPMCGGCPVKKHKAHAGLTSASLFILLCSSNPAPLRSFLNALSLLFPNKFNFLSWNNYIFTRSCKTSTERSHVCFSQLPPKVTKCRTRKLTLGQSSYFIQISLILICTVVCFYRILSHACTHVTMTVKIQNCSINSKDSHTIQFSNFTSSMFSTSIIMSFWEWYIHGVV